MAIRLFAISLFVVAILSYFIPVQMDNKNIAEDDVPLLTFNNSTMYTMDTQSMNRVVYAKQALRYKTKDIMNNAAMTMKDFDKNGKEITDTLYADVIIKKGDIFNFFNNVKYKRDDFVTLNSDEMVYDSKRRIATNTKPFDGTYYNHYIKGSDIYLDMNKYYMKSKNTHFEIELTK